MKSKLATPLLFLFSILIFSNVVFNGYNYDDELVTRNNKLTKNESSATLKDIFSSSYHEQYGYSYGYRPITTLSFFLEHRIFKESPTVSHLINLLLYAISILLLYWLISKMFPSINSYILFFICVFFTIHSTHSEVVASIKNRDEILSFLFLLLSLLCSIYWIAEKKMSSLLLILLFVSLSMLSKKSGLTILLIWPLWINFRYYLSLKNFIILAFCFLIPLVFFAFNFNFVKGVLLFLAAGGIYTLSCYVKSSGFFEKKFNPYKSFPFLLGILFLLVGIFFSELTIVFISGILFLYYTKRYVNFSLLILSLLFVISYGIFRKVVLIEIPIFFISAIFFSILNRHRLDWRPIVSILVIVMYFAILKGSLSYFFIFLIPLVVFYTSFYWKYLPLALSIISFFAGFIYFNITFFHFGLLFFSLVISFYNSRFKLFKFYALTFWIVFGSLYIIVPAYQANGSLFKTLELKEEMAEQFVEKRTTNLQEGRKLEYMENTLTAPHTLEQRIATGAIVLGEYFRLMIFPKELSFYYGYSRIQTTDFTDYSVWLSLLIHLSILFLVVYTYNKHLLVSFGLLWYFAAILLFSNWPVLVAGMVGERLAFIASVGFCIAIGGVLNWIKPNFNFKKPKAIEIVALSVLVLLSVRTIARNRLWESPEKLMSNDIAHLQNSAQANYMLAMAIVKDVVKNPLTPQETNPRLNKAIKYFRKAIEVYPGFYNYHYDLGRTFVFLENYREAKNAFEVAYKLEPNALISLNELVKTSFDLSEYADVIKYGKLYLEKNKNDYIIYELVAYSAYLVKDYQLAKSLIVEGLGFYPNNQNLKGLFIDVKKSI